MKITQKREGKALLSCARPVDRHSRKTRYSLFNLYKAEMDLCVNLLSPAAGGRGLKRTDSLWGCYTQQRRPPQAGVG